MDYLILTFLKRKRSAVHAVALASWAWAIVKNVAKMCLTNRTDHLSSFHSISSVGVFSYTLFIEWCIEARPACAGFKLCFGIEKRCSTTNTLINTLVMVVPIWPRKSSFRAFLTGYIKLRRCQNLLPLGFCFHNLCGLLGKK